MFPRLAITDPDDARTVFDALNAYYAHEYDRMDTATRVRVLELLIASHAEMNRETTS